MFIFAFLNKVAETFVGIGKSIKRSDNQAISELDRRASIDRQHEENVQEELRKYRESKR